MSDGIQRYNIFHASEDRYRSPEGEWVRFSDVAERDKEARELVAATKPLLRHLGKQCGCLAPGHKCGNCEESEALIAALAAIDKGASDEG